MGKETKNVFTTFFAQGRALLGSSNSMTFYDFFHDLFKFSKKLGLGVTFKNS